jgi:hypothetical protein
MLGKIVILNGNVNRHTIIVAHKPNGRVNYFDYDFIGSCTISPRLMSAVFNSEVIQEELNLDNVSLVGLYEEYSTIENIKKEFKRLQDDFFERKYQKEGFELISEDNFIKLCKKLYANRENMK